MWKLSSIRNRVRVLNEEMGSEGPKSVTIHVTGFKKFHGVAQNPTETTVNSLKDFVKKRGLPAGVTLGSCTVLETAGEGGLPTLLKVIESESSSENSSNNGQVIWVRTSLNFFMQQIAGIYTNYAHL